MDLIEKLIEGGILDQREVSLIKEEEENTGKTKEEIIIGKKLITEEELFNLKSEVTGFPLKKDVKPESVSRKLLEVIPEDSVSHYKMIVVGKSDDEVEIGMVYPENLKAQEALKFILRRAGISYKIYLISLSLFEELALKYTAPPKENLSPLIEKMVEEEIFKREDALLIEKEAEEKNKSIEEMLLLKNLITEEELFDLKSEVTGFPLKKDVDVDGLSVEDLNLIHEDSVSHYKMIVVGKSDDEVEIGMVYPENLKAQEALKFISRQNIFSYKIYLISFTLFEKVKKRYHSLNKEIGSILIEKLLERELLQKEQAEFVEKEAEKRKKTREDVILAEGMIKEEDLFNLKSEIVGVPFKKDFQEGEVDKDIFNLFPEDAINHYKMIPLGKNEEKIEIGMVYPENQRAKEAIGLIFEDPNSYQIFLISPTKFNELTKNIKTISKGKRSTLTERLVAENIINEEVSREIEEEAEKGGKTTEEILLGRKLIDEEKLFELKSEILDIPFANNVDVKSISEDLLRVIPEDSVNYYKMVPVGKTEDEIEVGMVYPENLRAKEALKFLSRRDGFSYYTSLITISVFEEILKEYRTLTKEVGEVLEDIDIDIDEVDETPINMDQDVGRLAEEAPIVKVVAVILRNAIEGSASDIHIEPGRGKLKVRFRVDGILYSSLYLPMTIHLAVIARIKILAGLKIDEQRLPQDGRFSTKRGGQNIDFRVSTFPTTLGEKVVIRVLDPKEGLRTLEELGVMGSNLQILKHSFKRPTGMTLVTGPTGSGKSTTLYSILGILNQEKVNIVTLEDPVEYFIEGVNQSQVHPEIGYVFSKGLRQILRQDPDVIMVGEIRDDETAELAIHAALTGHMVLSTLHTNNAIGAIPRLIDMGIKPFLIPPAINTLMSQRLVRRLCDKCKEQITPSEEIKTLMMKEIENIPDSVKKEIKIPSPFKIYVSKGCKACSEEGVVGRISINEILRMTPEIGEITMKNPTEKELQAEARKQGMITLKQDGMIKIIQGYTTIEEVLRATEEK
jgi:type IV pilus assembly protein PilB